MRGCVTIAQVSYQFPQRWQYTTTTFTTENVDAATEHLNSMGPHGWELVSVVFNPRFPYIYTAFWRWPIATPPVE